MSENQSAAQNWQALREQANIYACNCMGPLPGEPLCPCQMRNVVKRDGRWGEVEQDLGPVVPQVTIPKMQGCICPVGAEKTCQGSMCPRKPMVIS